MLIEANAFTTTLCSHPRQVGYDHAPSDIVVVPTVWPLWLPLCIHFLGSGGALVLAYHMN